VLLPEAAIRNIQYSAGVGSSKGKSNIKNQNGNPQDALRQTTNQKSKVKFTESSLLGSW